MWTFISSHCPSCTLLTLEGRLQEGWSVGPLSSTPNPSEAQMCFPDRTGLHSPDTLVEDEELLVGQALALEDRDHSVMDTVGRKESGHPEALGLLHPSRPASSHLSSPIQSYSASPEITGAPIHTLLQLQVCAPDAYSGSPEPARHPADPVVQPVQNFPSFLHVSNPPSWARHWGGVLCISSLFPSLVSRSRLCPHSPMLLVPWLRPHEPLGSQPSQPLPWGSGMLAVELTLIGLCSLQLSEAGSCKHFSLKGQRVSC